MVSTPKYFFDLEKIHWSLEVTLKIRSLRKLTFPARYYIICVISPCLLSYLPFPFLNTSFKFLFPPFPGSFSCSSFSCSWKRSFHHSLEASLPWKLLHSQDLPLAKPKRWFSVLIFLRPLSNTDRTDHSFLLETLPSLDTTLTWVSSISLVFPLLSFQISQCLGASRPSSWTSFPCTFALSRHKNMSHGPDTVSLVVSLKFTAPVQHLCDLYFQCLLDISK